MMGLIDFDGLASLFPTGLSDPKVELALVGGSLCKACGPRLASSSRCFVFRELCPRVLKRRPLFFPVLHIIVRQLLHYTK